VHFALVGMIVGDPLRRDTMPGMMVEFGFGPSGEAFANTMVLVFPAVIVVATLIHLSIEAPFMRLRSRYVEDKTPAPQRPS